MVEFDAMKSWRLIRIPTLITACCASTAVLASIIIAPQSNYNDVQEFEFPETTALADWTLLQSAPFFSEPIANENIADSITYTLQTNNYSLDIHRIYFHSSDGNVEQLLDEHTRILDATNRSLTIQTIEKDRDTSYVLVTDELNEEMHLAACVTAHGFVTAMPDQFERTRHFDKLSFTQQWEWFLGQRRIQDYRCLLTIFSMPVRTSSIADIEATLEAAWQEWHLSQGHSIASD